MSEEIEDLFDPEENPEGMSFLDTVKAYTEDLEAPVPPHQEYSPTPSHTSLSLFITDSSSGSHSRYTSDEEEESDYTEDDDEGEGGSDSEDLSSTPSSTPSTLSSAGDFWTPAPDSNASRRSTPKTNSNPHLPTPSSSTRKNKDKRPSPSLFISLLSSSSSDSSRLSSSDDEVTIIRSRALSPRPLKRKLLDSLEPRKKIRHMVLERERDPSREWSVRDRGVLAEAMQDGMDFNGVARMLGREVDEVFRMFTKVIAGTLLYAPRPRDEATQTE